MPGQQGRGRVGHVIVVSGVGGHVDPGGTVLGQACLALLRAHPDLVGRLARQGRLTRESTSERNAVVLAMKSCTALCSRTE